MDDCIGFTDRRMNGAMSKPFGSPTDKSYDVYMDAVLPGHDCSDAVKRQTESLDLIVLVHQSINQLLRIEMFDQDTKVDVCFSGRESVIAISS
ncbi:MAG: hypothetical protein WC083_05180 [Candidatus Methanomethylophilaceae archaeon]